MDNEERKEVGRGMGNSMKRDGAEHEIGIGLEIAEWSDVCANASVSELNVER